MKLRVLALLALTAALVPVWAGEVITQDTRINRQRITTVLNAPNAFQVPQTSDYCQNRQRITNIFDLPGTVRNALPTDPQLDLRRMNMTPKPGPYMGPRLQMPNLEKGANSPKIDNKPPKKAEKEEVMFQDVAKDKAADAKKADSDPCVVQKLTLVDWKCGRQFKDDKGRVWFLVQGNPQADKPAVLEGWMFQAADSPIYFFSKTGRMWRLHTVPLNQLKG